MIDPTIAPSILSLLSVVHDGTLGHFKIEERGIKTRARLAACDGENAELRDCKERRRCECEEISSAKRLLGTIERDMVRDGTHIALFGRSGRRLIFDRLNSVNVASSRKTDCALFPRRPSSVVRGPA